MSTLAPAPNEITPEKGAILRDAALLAPEALARLVWIETTSGPVPFSPWDYQVELWRRMRQERRLIVLKGRQLGASQAVALYALWHALAHPGSTTLILSVGEREARELLRRISRVYDSLPKELKRWWRGTFRSEDATIRTQAGSSQIISVPSGGTAGRGFTVSLLIGDEAAFWPDSDSKLAAVLPGMADTGRVVLISTANGMSGRYHDIWMNAPDLGWDRYFIRADARPGREGDWINRERASLGDLGAQEYPLDPDEAFLSTGASVFDIESLMSLKEVSCEPAKWRGHITEDAEGVTAQSFKDGPWHVWEWPRPGRSYVIAADACAGKASGDYAHAVVVDAHSWEQMACYHAKTEPHQFAVELRRAGWLFQTNPDTPALLVPEANNHGAGVIAQLREMGYPRVYRHTRFDQESVNESAGLGFYTSLKTKPLAIAALQQAIQDKAVGIRDEEAIAEMTRYITTDTGKMQAAPGSHDDRVMTWAIAVTALTHTNQAIPQGHAYAYEEQIVAPRVNRPAQFSITGY